jgi:hypothetical protein
MRASSIILAALISIGVLSWTCMETAEGVPVHVRFRDLSVIGAPQDSAVAVDMASGGDSGASPLSFRGTACAYAPVAAAAGDNSTITPSATYTKQLIVANGAGSLVGAFSASPPSESALSPAMIVNAPNTQCPTVVGRALVSVTIPRNSTIRQVEGYWNGTRLPLVAVYNTPQDTLVDDYNVNYGGTDVERIPFNTPLWSLAGVATGAGTLEVRGYDATNHLVSKVTIPNLYNSPAPTPVDSSALSARSHPRFLLTPTRLAEPESTVQVPSF